MFSCIQLKSLVYFSIKISRFVERQGLQGYQIKTYLTSVSVEEAGVFLYTTEIFSVRHYQDFSVCRKTRSARVSNQNIFDICEC